MIDAVQFRAVETVLAPARLARYTPAAGGDKLLSLRYYLWNCALCEAFQKPLHFAEIACRNAIHEALQFHIGPDWHNDSTLRKVLSPRFVDELDFAISEERIQRGDKMTAHDVVSALSFGFWEHLTTKRFERMLWKRGVAYNFKGMPHSKKREDLHSLIESVRRWRNRIAHHRAIFDKGPSAKYADTIELVSWACDVTGKWVAGQSRVSQTIDERPA